MSSTGVVRKIDQLGRIVIPKEVRDVLELKEKSSLEVYTSEDSIILKKYNPGCIFCGDIENVKRIKKNLVCNQCIKELSSISQSLAFV